MPAISHRLPQNPLVLCALLHAERRQALATPMPDVLAQEVDATDKWEQANIVGEKASHMIDQTKIAARGRGGGSKRLGMIVSTISTRRIN